MRACAAILFLTAWPCFIHAQYSRARGSNPNFANGINENLIRLVPCVKSLGLSKCVGAYGVWRAERFLQIDAQTNQINSKMFPWQRYYNVSDDELYTKLCDGAERLLQLRSLELNLNQDYSLQLGVTGNGSLNIDVLKSGVTSGRTSMKKLEKYFYELVPFILLPGLLMSAVLPFFLPTFKLVTLGTVMLNNMALTGAVFSLLRNNAFNDKYSKKVIYLNSGYINDHESLSDSASEIILDEDFDKYPGKYAAAESNDVKDFHFAGNEALDNDITADWLKQFPGKDDENFFRNNFIGSDWKKRNDFEKSSDWVS